VEIGERTWRVARQTKSGDATPPADATEGRGATPEVVRGRPGRRTADQRRDAVLAVLSGKATVDQTALKYGVLPDTVEGWRDEAVAAIGSSFARGDSRSARERELEREVDELKRVVGTLSVEKAVLLKAVDEWKRETRPSRPTRSRR
jgi:transposase-like protein